MSTSKSFGIFFLLLVAAATTSIAEEPVLCLKWVSRNPTDGSYRIMVDNVLRRIPSAGAVNEDHHIPGTLYKVELYAPGFSAPGVISEKLCKLQLVHEVTGARIILMFGLTAVIEDPDGRVPRYRQDDSPN